MPNFVIYAATGQILRTGSCPDDHVSIQAQTGEFVMVGVVNNSAQYVDATATPPALISYPTQQDRYHTWDWPTKSWILPSTALVQAQSDQAAILNAACQNAIYAGAQSSALGSPHTYPAKNLDQSNLIASVTASLYPGLPSTWTTPFWCMDANGVWAYVMHTAAQIQQVGADAKAVIVANLNKNAALQANVRAAVDIPSVQAVVW